MSIFYIGLITAAMIFRVWAVNTTSETERKKSDAYAQIALLEDECQQLRKRIASQSTPQRIVPQATHIGLHKAPHSPDRDTDRELQ